jgi:trehalose/maltose transport system permease protein
VFIVAFFPLLQTFYLSFTDQQFLAGISTTHIIGWKNYSDLLDDISFRNSIVFTIKFAFVTVILEFVLGMVVALVVNSQFKGRGLMRTAMLVPWAIPTVISTKIWQWMYNDIYGVVNDLMLRVHLIHRPVAWIAESSTALPAIAAVDIWKTTPFVALLLLAGLQVIPGDIYEAANVDGASKVQQFFQITLPLLRPAILVTLVFRTLDALRVFDVVYVMFQNRLDTQTMTIYAQSTIVGGQVGYGSAISVAIFVIILIFVVAYVSIFRMDTR